MEKKKVCEEFFRFLYYKWFSLNNNLIMYWVCILEDFLNYLLKYSGFYFLEFYVE